MKNIASVLRKMFLTLFISFLTATLFSQTIIGVQNYPTNPTNIDNINIFTENFFTSGPCWIDSSNIVINGNDIVCDAYFSVGMLAVMCTSYDTFQLGQLNDGTYQFHFNLYMSMNSTLHDSVTISFTIGSVGYENKYIQSSEIIYPNPSQGIFTLSLKQEDTDGEVTLKVFSPDGKEIKTFNIRSSEHTTRIDLSYLPAGNYFYYLELKDRHKIKSGMLIITYSY